MKDCTNCQLPHKSKNYGYVTGKYQELAEPLERRMTRRAHHMNISLEIESMEKLGTVVGHLRAQGVRIFDFEVNRSGSAALPNFLCQFSAVLPDRRDHPELLAELSALDGVILIEEI